MTVTAHALAVVATATPVPGPDLAARPGLFHPGALTVTLLVIGIVGVLLFVPVVMTAHRRRGAVALWAPTLVSASVLLGGAIGGALLYHRDEEQHLDDYADWVAAVDAAQPVLRDALEAAYGITIEDWERIPVEPGAFDHLTITRADGTVDECWFTLEGTYDVRCGEIRSAGTELPLVPDASR
ncbi:hypothetical protein ACTHAM_003059 [Cellulomonas soli]|uniref:hypothetical protein n=1 Tax=Cellulomonas soli TaxID=931535 RepID=UPI003F82F072